MRVTYTIHALNRYYERFPDCPITIYQACEESIPYGRQTDSTKVTIHPTHKIVFIIDKNTQTPTLKTVLTQQLYIANAQANTHTRTHTHTPTDQAHIVRVPEPAKTKPQDPKEKEKSYKERLKEQLQAELEKERQIEIQATEYACLKNYEPWCKDFKNEAKTKYNISRKHMQSIFVPQYYRECGLYHMFQQTNNPAKQ